MGRLSHGQTSGAGGKGGTVLEHFLLVTSLQLSESKPLTVTYPLCTRNQPGSGMFSISYSPVLLLG